MTTSLLASDQDLLAIGFRLDYGAPASYDPESADIEQTLLNVLAAFPEDYRIAAIAMAWIKVHGKYIIAERISKLCNSEGDRACPFHPWLSFIAAWAVECGYYKWRMLIKKEKSPVYLYDPEVSESVILRKGAMPWCIPFGFRIPLDSLRIRESDVLTPQELMRYNLQYRNRYIYGPSWRADIITAIQRGITSPMAISRAVGCSYEPAHRISREYLMAMNAIREDKEMKKRARKKKP